MQTSGRAARHVEGKVIFYADRQTESIRKTLVEVTRRRKIQAEYNRQNGITPTTIQKQIREILGTVYEADYYTVPLAAEEGADFIATEAVPRKIMDLEKEMLVKAKNYEYEQAAELRDQIRRLREKLQSPT